MKQTPWKLKRLRQCDKCPWRKAIDPYEIPNGYDKEKHRALAGTIADPGDLSHLYAPELRIMACHELHDTHCVGWLIHQLGPGNNIPLRINMLSCTNAAKLQTVGDQHETFGDTLP